MEIGVEIETRDGTLCSDLFEAKRISRGLEKEIGSGLKIRYENTQVRESVGIPEIISITLNFGTMVAAGYLANWLYDKLHGRATKIRIDNLEIEIDRGEIERVLRQKVEIE
jgi:hypothetical protein